MALNAPPIQQPMYNGQSMAPSWIAWFDAVWKALNRTPDPVTIPIAAVGVTPPGVLGELYVTSTGILAIYNGTQWRKYDGTAVTF